MQRWFAAGLRLLFRATASFVFAVVLLFAAINLLALVEPEPLAAPARTALAIVDVGLVDVAGDGRIVEQQTIVVDDGRIVFAGPRERAAIPAAARIIDGRGRYALAGLWDAHVHTLRLSPQLHFPLLIAHGVTRVRDMGEPCSWSVSLDCAPSTPGWRDAIANGAIVGPRIVATVGHHIEEVDDAAALSERITALQIRGERIIKLQLDDPSLFAHAVRTAHAQGLAVAGHVPPAADLLTADSVPDSIEHDASLLPQCSSARAAYDGRNRSKAALLEGLDSARCSALIADLARRGIAYAPTHTAASGQDLAFADGGESAVAAIAARYVIAPQRWLWAVMRAAGEVDADEAAILARMHRAALDLTRDAHHAGVPVIAGSDPLDADVLHGDGLHRELEYLVAAGLSPAQALAAATIVPARLFGAPDDAAVLQAGQRADIVLLAADPLADIANARRIDAVIADGRLYDRTRLEAARDYVSEQAGRLTTIARFVRGLWYDG
jgi:imidazolonepropionase-like amidohydrolase